MLLNNRTVILIIGGNSLGFFTSLGNVIPFSLDLYGFRRSFKVEGKTRIKIYIGHDAFIINKVHNVIEKKTIFLKFHPKFDIRSSSGRKIERIASFVGS